MALTTDQLLRVARTRPLAIFELTRLLGGLKNSREKKRITELLFRARQRRRARV